MLAAIDAALAAHGLSRGELDRLATAPLKRDEPALSAAGAAIGRELDHRRRRSAAAQRRPGRSPTPSCSLAHDRHAVGVGGGGARRGRAAAAACSVRASCVGSVTCAIAVERRPRHDRAFHRRRAGRCRPDHRARPRPARALPGLPLCRLDRAGRAAAILPGRRPHRRHRADVARRDRARICRRAPRRPGCRAAAFRRSLGLERRRRADPPAGAAGHSLHADARRPVLRRSRRCARPRADHPGSRAEPGADARLRPRLRDAGGRDAGRLRQRPARRWRSISPSTRCRRSSPS